MMIEKLASEIGSLARRECDYVADLLQRAIRIPSPSCEEGAVIGLLAGEMESLRPDEVFTDSFGSVVGRFGSGKKVILYDSHVDTVGVGDPSSWAVDPYAAVRRDEVIYGRGASDNKAGIACMVAGLKLMVKLAQRGDFTLYVVGIVQEEDCEGLALGALLEEKGIKPDCVVLGECTNLAINRGHRGRAELTVTTRGKSCHASAPERGENAVYKITPIIEGIKSLADRLPSDPFLGKGSIAVTKVECATPSLNAVPDMAKIYVDRRVVPSDTRVSIARELDEIARFAGAEVAITKYGRPSHTGLVKEREKFFPAWTVPEGSREVVAGSRAYRLLFGGAPAVGKWVFSTDGNYSMGMRAIPTIGFGPAEERHAHAADDQVRVDDLWKSVAFYALFPYVYSSL
jgi:putative selenium metabolism hydrolase